MKSEQRVEGHIYNGKAVAALTCGILSILMIFVVFLAPIFGVAGLVLGLVALKEINSNLHHQGRKMAVAAIICSSLGILLSVFLVIISYYAFTTLP